MKKKLISALLGVTMAAGMITGNCSTLLADEGDGKQFSVLITRSDWGDSDLSLEGFVAESQEKAGVDIDWQVYLDTEWGDKKSVVLANNDLPDAFLGALNSTDVNRNKELFIPLEDLIAE
ncbi:MAG TPA: sugar ABC transporter substrate-binding protein, partial [Lachnospiraceae bacterium]|nr:sugar ABC transporter substrate-binding protein [Lachnospiraceae bacterium]